MQNRPVRCIANNLHDGKNGTWPALLQRTGLYRVWQVSCKLNSFLLTTYYMHTGQTAAGRGRIYELASGPSYSQGPPEIHISWNNVSIECARQQIASGKLWSCSCLLNVYKIMYCNRIFYVIRNCYRSTCLFRLLEKNTLWMTATATMSCQLCLCSISRWVVLHSSIGDCLEVPPLPTSANAADQYGCTGDIINK